MPNGSPTPPGISLPSVIEILIIAGAIGGLVNAFLSAEGFIVSRMETLADGKRIWRPGFLGNVFVGTVTAFVLGALYGPLTQILLGSGAPIPINFGTVAGAVMSGIGGARLLTQEVDKKIGDATNKQMNQVINNLIPVPPRENQ